MRRSKRLLKSSEVVAEVEVKKPDENDGPENDEDFFRIFPEEIWIMILNKTDNCLKQMILNSNLYHFRRLLLPSRQNFLFRYVWDIISDKYKDKLDKDNLHLRKVSTGWRDGFDKVASKRVIVAQMIQETEEETPVGFWNNKEFDNTPKVTQFLEHFKRTENSSGSDCAAVSNNPFAIGGHVHFTTSPDQDPEGDRGNKIGQQFHKAVKELLAKYGEYLIFCKISIMDNYSTRLEYFKSIHEWLKLMPNLIALEWQYDGGYVFPQDLRPYVKSLENTPIPAWKHLRIAKFTNVPIPVVDHILTENNSFLVLTTVPKIFSVNKVILPDLQRFAIGITSNNDFIKLEKCQQEWKMQMVCLDFKYATGISWKRIYNLFSKWTETLREVTIRIPLTTMADAEKHNDEVKLLKEKYTSLPKQGLRRINLVFHQVYDRM